MPGPVRASSAAAAAEAVCSPGPGPVTGFAPAPVTVLPPLAGLFSEMNFPPRPPPLQASGRQNFTLADLFGDFLPFVNVHGPIIDLQGEQGGDHDEDSHVEVVVDVGAAADGTTTTGPGLSGMSEAGVMQRSRRHDLFDDHPPPESARDNNPREPVCIWRVPE